MTRRNKTVDTFVKTNDMKIIEFPEQRVRP